MTNVIHLASRCAAKTVQPPALFATSKPAPVSTAPASEPYLIAQQQAIENALSMALYFIRQPHSVNALQAATGKANRALTLLKTACIDSKTCGAQPSEATTASVNEKHPVTRHADGRRTGRGALPFFTIEFNRRGGRKSQNLFDVPVEQFTDGLLTGYRCAAELMATLKKRDRCGPAIHLSKVIEAVIEAGKDSASKPGRAGASVAFMEVVTDAVKFMADYGETAPLLAAKIKDAEKGCAYWAALQATERADFVQRMKAAREAKRRTRAPTAPPVARLSI